MSRLDELLDGVEGYLHPDEPAFLASLAAQVQPPHCIVEIGSFRGRSTIALAYGAADGVYVWSVDPHEEHDVQGLPFGGADNQAFMLNVSRAGAGHKVRAVNLPSHLAIASFWNELVDFRLGLLFIDGAHDYHDVSIDVRLWGRLLVDDGILALHDANTWEGPTRVADELAADFRWTEVEGCAYTRVFRKGEFHPR